jgi:hypothetical protein
LDRITDAFIWPVRDPQWLTKILIIGLIGLIPIVGGINAIGWMLASIDRLRGGEQRLAEANFSYLARGVQLFVVQLVYVLALGVLIAAVYVPALVLAARQSHGSADAATISLVILLSVLSLSIAVLGSLAFTFATPAIVLATDKGGIVGGLDIRSVVRQSLANPTNTLIAGLMLIAAGFISSLGIVACGIGMLFTLTYALAVQAWVFRSFEIGSPASGVRRS